MAFETFAAIHPIPTGHRHTTGRDDREIIAIESAESNERTLRQLTEIVREHCRTMKWEEPKPTKAGDILYDGEASWIYEGAHLKIVDAGNGKADAFVVLPALIDIVIDLSDTEKGE